MKEFVISALPFVVGGICLIVIVLNSKKEDKTYLTEGMCLGMCLGLSLSTALNLNIGLGISLGMLIGETIGVLVKKIKYNKKVYIF